MNRTVHFLILAAALVISAAMFVVGNRYAYVAPDGRYYALKLDRWTGKTWTVLPFEEYVNLRKGLHPSVVERPVASPPMPLELPKLPPGVTPDAELDMLLRGTPVEELMKRVTPQPGTKPNPVPTAAR